MRLKEKQLKKAPESVRNRETLMQENLEKESAYYDRYFKNLEDIKIRYT